MLLGTCSVARVLSSSLSPSSLPSFVQPSILFSSLSCFHCFSLLRSTSTAHASVASAHALPSLMLLLVSSAWQQCLSPLLSLRLVLRVSVSLFFFCFFDEFVTSYRVLSSVANGPGSTTQCQWCLFVLVRVHDIFRSLVEARNVTDARRSDFFSRLDPVQLSLCVPSLSLSSVVIDSCDWCNCCSAPHIHGNSKHFVAHWCEQRKDQDRNSHVTCSVSSIRVQVWSGSRTEAVFEYCFVKRVLVFASECAVPVKSNESTILTRPITQM